MIPHNMMKFFLPTSRKVLHTFQTFCPVGVQIAHWQCTDGCSICSLSSSGQEKRCSGAGVHIPERSVWRLSKEQLLCVAFWAKWDPIWANWALCTKNAQKCSRIGPTTNLGEKHMNVYNKSWMLYGTYHNMLNNIKTKAIQYKAI